MSTHAKPTNRQPNNANPTAAESTWIDCPRVRTHVDGMPCRHNAGDHVSRKTFVIFGTKVNPTVESGHVKQIACRIYGERGNLSETKVEFGNGSFFLALKFKRDQRLSFGEKNQGMWKTILLDGGKVFINIIGSAGSSGHHEGPWQRVVMPFMLHPNEIKIVSDGPNNCWLEK